MEEMLRERFQLSRDRIEEVRTEERIQEPYRDYFQKSAEFLKIAAEQLERKTQEHSLE